MTTISEGTAVILAAHGVPATDCPRTRVGLLMMMHFAGRIVERVGFLRAYRDSLDDQVRRWPRTADNDPYKAAVDGLAAKLSARLGRPVAVAYNEFCAPTIAQAFDQAVTAGVRRVVVVPTMLVRGNEHTEREIRGAVAEARERYPSVDIRYAWPFDEEQLVSFLANQVAAYK